MFKSETKPVQGTTTAQEKGEQQELNIHYSQKSLAYFQLMLFIVRII